MEAPLDNLVHEQELVRMAVKLRQELSSYEKKQGSCGDFAELKSSAEVLLVAILQPLEFSMSSSPKKTAEMSEFSTTKRSAIPMSLH